MKYCPKCGCENKDQYICCEKCNTPLPKTARLGNLISRAESAMDSGDFRAANKALAEYVQLSPGDRDAQFLFALTLVQEGMGKEARQAFEAAGVRFRGGECKQCRGSAKCFECGHSGRCNICMGRGFCSMCNGTGQCYQCKGPSCPRCKGTGVCVRCKGQKACAECGGEGKCSACRGNDVCLACGGTGKSMELVEDTTPPRYRKYLRMY